MPDLRVFPGAGLRAAGPGTDRSLGRRVGRVAAASGCGLLRPPRPSPSTLPAASRPPPRA